MADEFIEESWLQKIGFLGDQGLLAEHNSLGGGGVGQQQTPVDVSTIAEIRVVGLLRNKFKVRKKEKKRKNTDAFTYLSGEGENLLHELLGAAGALEEQLDDGSQQLQLDL